MNQQDMFPDLFVPRKYDPAENGRRGPETIWPLHEVGADIVAVCRILDHTGECDEASKLKNAAWYFIYKYGQERGFACFLIWRKLLVYLHRYQDELEDMGAAKMDEEGNLTFQPVFLEQLISGLLGGGGGGKGNEPGPRDPFSTIPSDEKNNKSLT